MQQLAHTEQLAAMETALLLPLVILRLKTMAVVQPENIVFRNRHREQVVIQRVLILIRVLPAGQQVQPVVVKIASVTAREFMDRMMLAEMLTAR